MREEIIRLRLEIPLFEREVSKCLLEIPLIQLADIARLKPAATKIILDGWMAEAKASDKQLGIIRDTIPFAPVYIPEQPNSADFFNFALAIGEIPKPQVAPQNHNQACWIKTIQYYWQARGLVLAHRLFGVIPDSLGKEGILSGNLPETTLKTLRLDRDIDLACYRLLVEGMSVFLRILNAASLQTQARLLALVIQALPVSFQSELMVLFQDDG